MADKAITALTEATTLAATDVAPATVGGNSRKWQFGTLAKMIATGVIALAAATLTDPAPMTLTQTWNDVADTFTALKVNVTDTNSAAGSLLLDLQVGGASKFKVDKTGIVTIKKINNVVTLAFDIGPQTGLSSISNNQVCFSGAASDMSSLARTAEFFFDGNASYLEVDVIALNRLTFDTFISRSALGIARLGTAYNNSLGSMLALSYRYDATNVITEATTARTLAATDNGRTIICTSGSATTITVPAGLGAAFWCRVIRGGTGTVTFAASGTTVNSAGSLLSIAAQYNAANLYATAANVFLLDGTLA